MGDSQAATGFGQIDLDLEDESSPAVPAPAPASSAKASFGELDFDLGDGHGEDEEPAPPPSTSRVFGAEQNRRATRNSLAAHTDSTAIFDGDALSAVTRPPPKRHQSNENTRAFSVDQALLALGEEPAPPSHSRDQPSHSRDSRDQPAPSASGVASRGGRVAAMRELYAKGDADGALALAATLNESMPPSGIDHPDASIVVEFGEGSIDLSDPFGGLIPLEDELSSTATVSPPPLAATAPPPRVPSKPPCAAPQLTLTERHSIPRLLKSMAEISTLKIDHRVGFLLAHVDGMQTLEEILDICAMPATEALELIDNLKRMGVIEFE